MTSRGAEHSQVDHVIGAFPRERLSGALAATHRAGFGPQCRVFDGARDPTARQLERAGLRIRGDAQPASEAMLIVVTAPGRVEVVAELFNELGAEVVYLAGRRELAAPAQASGAAMLPDIRIVSSEADA